MPMMRFLKPELWYANTIPAFESMEFSQSAGFFPNRVTRKKHDIFVN